MTYKVVAESPNGTTDEMTTPHQHEARQAYQARVAEGVNGERAWSRVTMLVKNAGNYEILAYYDVTAAFEHTRGDA